MIKGAAKAWEAMKQVASPEERKEFEAIENKDKILEAQKKKLAAADPVRAVIIEKMNQEGVEALDSDMIRYLMDTKPKPKEASPKQMEYLKNNFEKYKSTQQKPFIKPRQGNAPTAKKLPMGNVPTTNKPLLPDPKLKEIEDGLRKLDILKGPEPTVEEIIKERAEKRLRQDQSNWDRQFGRGGIPELYRPT